MVGPHFLKNWRVRFIIFSETVHEKFLASPITLPYKHIHTINFVEMQSSDEFHHFSCMSSWAQKQGDFIVLRIFYSFALDFEGNEDQYT